MTMSQLHMPVIEETKVMTIKSRLGDDLPPPPRSKRIFHSSNHWYFETREGRVVGPYHNKQDAEKAADEFVEFAQTASKSMLDKLLEYISKI